MSDTWAGVLALSVAVIALVQVAYVVVWIMASRKLMSAVENTQRQVEALASDVRLRVGAVSDRVTAVADDLRVVTSRVQQVASSVADGVQRVEDQVKAAGQKVQATVDRVPPGVKKGVPAGLAILAALRTVQQVRQRLKNERASHDMYAAS
jgi:uncharacterized protein YoxC